MADPTREQAKLIKAAKTFSKKISPLLENTGNIIDQARSLFSAYASAGYHALLIPQKFGGMGLDYQSAGLVYETLSYELPGTLHGTITSAHCSEMIQNAYQNSFHEQILSSIAKDKLCSGFCLTEDSGGSDISSIFTTVRRSEKGFVINGRKSIVINHAIAGVFIVFATSSPDRGRAGINAFLVRSNLPGVQKSDPYVIEGFQGSVLGSVIFKEVKIPGECLLGDEGSGYLLFMETLDKGRPLVAASCVGEASRALDLITVMAKQRTQFGKTLDSFQGISFQLADLATRLAASRLLYLNALERIDNGQPFTMESSMSKLHAAETLHAIAGFGMEILGHRSVIESNVITRIFHDSLLMKNIDGTANVQKMVIASQL
jgi:alkylation response protein AidB-like acyl-CoA dehydrogenase